MKKRKSGFGKSRDYGFRTYGHSGESSYSLSDVEDEGSGIESKEAAIARCASNMGGDGSLAAITLKGKPIGYIHMSGYSGEVKYAKPGEIRKYLASQGMRLRK